MKAFTPENSPWAKVNFVDDNNVLLGYDLETNCCEIASWFITDTPLDSKNPLPETKTQPTELPGFNFDTSYLIKDNNPDVFDEGAIVTFRLFNSEGQEKFLHLYNMHNGYYSHGFEFQTSEESLIQASI